MGSFTGYITDSDGKPGIPYVPWVDSGELSILAKTNVIVMVDKTQKFVMTPFSGESARELAVVTDNGKEPEALRGEEDSP